MTRTLGALAVTLALCLLVFVWATSGAPEPVPAGLYIIPMFLAALLVVVVAAMMRNR
jgi:hypothetical protein